MLQPWWLQTILSGMRWYLQPTEAGNALGPAPADSILLFNTCRRFSVSQHSVKSIEEIPGDNTPEEVERRRSRRSGEAAICSFCEEEREYCRSSTKCPIDRHSCVCFCPNCHKQAAWWGTELPKVPREHQNWKTFPWFPVLFTDEHRFTEHT